MSGHHWLPLACLEVEVMLRRTVSRPFCRCQALIWGLRPDFYYCQTRICCLTRGRVCRLQLLLALASAVILGSESRRTHDDILLSQIRESPNLEGQISLFMSPQERGSQSYFTTGGLPPSCESVAVVTWLRNHCLATDVFSGSIPAFSRRVTNNDFAMKLLFKVFIWSSVIIRRFPVKRRLVCCCSSERNNRLAQATTVQYVRQAVDNLSLRRPGFSSSAVNEIVASKCCVLPVCAPDPYNLLPLS
jgi:hypothetical protein